MEFNRPQVDVGVFRVIGHRVAERRRAALVANGVAITPAVAQALYDRLTSLQAPDGCRITRLDTSRFRMTVGVRPPGAGEQQVGLANGPEGGGGRSVGGWTIAAPPVIERDCAQTVAAIERVVVALPPLPVAGAGARVDLTSARTARRAGLLLLAVALGLVGLVERRCPRSSR